MKILVCGDSFAADWTVKYMTKRLDKLIEKNTMLQI